MYRRAGLPSEVPARRFVFKIQPDHMCRFRRTRARYTIRNKNAPVHQCTEAAYYVFFTNWFPHFGQ